MAKVSKKRQAEIVTQLAESSRERVILNVGGQTHETYVSTLKNYPDTRLYWAMENCLDGADYKGNRIELFFDRHPGTFTSILNYYRTGKLHCPNDVCGPLFEEELAFWGIDEKQMEPCCWAQYTQHREAEENLKDFMKTDQDVEYDKRSFSSVMTFQGQSFLERYKPHIWSIVDDPRSSKAAKIFSMVSIALIAISVTASCISTLPSLRKISNKADNTAHVPVTIFFDIIEYFCGIWFTLEFIIRVMCCPDKIQFFKSIGNWVDLFAVVPFYLRIGKVQQKIVDGLLVIRVLRLFRFFKVLYGLQVIIHTLKASSYELCLLLFILFIPVILFSSIIYSIEQQFDEGTAFESIPQSLWWSLITMTTVGYGDIAPKSWAGKLVGGTCAVMGLLVVALPISIIGSNFTLYYSHAQALLKLPKKEPKLLVNTLTAFLSQDRQRDIKRVLRRRASTRSMAWECERNSRSPSDQSRYSAVAKPSICENQNGIPYYARTFTQIDEEELHSENSVQKKAPLATEDDQNEAESRANKKGIKKSSSWQNIHYRESDKKASKFSLPDGNFFTHTHEEGRRENGVTHDDSSRCRSYSYNPSRYPPLHAGKNHHDNFQGKDTYDCPSARRPPIFTSSKQVLSPTGTNISDNEKHDIAQNPKSNLKQINEHTSLGPVDPSRRKSVTLNLPRLPQKGGATYRTHNGPEITYSDA